MAYAKRYAGGFFDNAGGATPIDSTFLNAVEAALLKLFGVDASADGQALLWKLANGRYEPALISNANIDPAAAIAKSKLAALNISDADIAAAAGIAASKLGGNIPISKLSGYPGALQQVPRGDGTWGQGTQGLYRKTTPKVVVNSSALTDLLNGEIAVAPGVMGTNGMIRLTAFGDMINNTGATTATPAWQVVLGGTTVLTIGGVAAGWAASAGRFSWRAVAEIMNLGAANSQWCNLSVTVTGSFFSGSSIGTEGVNYTLTNDIGGVQLGNSSTLDTTTAKSLALNVQLPVASASCDVTLKGAVVELV